MKSVIAAWWCFGLALLFSCKPANNNPLDKYNRGQMLSDIYSQAILPVHQQLKQATASLDSAAQVFSQGPSATTLSALQQQWVATQAAWQVCEPMNIGDVGESFIHNTINKWPTNQAFIENYITGSSTINEALIEGAGSTSKGLPAVEFLIFGDNTAVLDALTTGTYAARRMAYLTALTANLKTKGAALYSMWQNYQGTFVSSTGLAIDGSVSLMVNAFIAQEEFIKNNKVGKPAGKPAGSIDTTLVESGLSDISLQNIAGNLQGINALLNGTLSGNGNGIYTYLDAVDPMADGQKLSDKIKTQIQACITAAGNINQPLEVAITANPAQVDALYLELKKLTVLLKVDLTSILGITVTFSDNDGD